jgi:hypothetical protein
LKVGFGIAAAILALALTTLTPPAQACNGGGNCENAPGQNKHVSGASWADRWCRASDPCHWLRRLLADQARRKKAALTFFL